MNSGRWAIAYAEKLGWRGFPRLPRDKRPAVKDWPAVVTDAPEMIAEFWRAPPDASVAVATGPNSGIVVLDGGPERERALIDLERRNGPFRSSGDKCRRRAAAAWRGRDG